MNEPKKSKVRPLADVSPVWERDLSVYPDTVRIAMEDGQVVDYRIDIRQPHPSLVSALDQISGMPVYPADATQGYKARHEAIKKVSRWERFLAARQKK